MVYLDSSSLLKLLWPEAESDAVRSHRRCRVRVGPRVSAGGDVVPPLVEHRAQLGAGGGTPRPRKESKAPRC